MEKKRSVFLCRLPIINYVILGIMCAVMIPFAILGILRLAEVSEFVSDDKPFDIAAVIAEVLATAFVLVMTFLTRYVVTKEHFIFQRIIPTKIPIDKLLLLRHETSEDMLVLYYADDNAPDGVRFVVLRVFPKKMQFIVQAIQKANPRVAYEMFDNTRKEIDD